MTRRVTHRQLWTIGASLLLIAGLGAAIALAPPVLHVSRPADPESDPVPPSATATSRDDRPQDPRSREIRERFDEALVMLHAKKFEYAITALHRVLELNPRIPEAHVNMGYAMLGLERFDAARDFFLGAVDLNPSLANAYYGLAMAHEGLRELPEAIGAMRTYLHLAPSGAESRFAAKARAALWEWESQVVAANEPARSGAPQPESRIPGAAPHDLSQP